MFFSTLLSSHFFIVFFFFFAAFARASQRRFSFFLLPLFPDGQSLVVAMGEGLTRDDLERYEQKREEEPREAE